MANLGSEVVALWCASRASCYSNKLAGKPWLRHADGTGLLKGATYGLGGGIGAMEV